MLSGNFFCLFEIIGSSLQINIRLYSRNYSTIQLLKLFYKNPLMHESNERSLEHIPCISKLNSLLYTIQDLMLNNIMPISFIWLMLLDSFCKILAIKAIYESSRLSLTLSNNALALSLSLSCFYLELASSSILKYLVFCFDHAHLPDDIIFHIPLEE